MSPVSKVIADLSGFMPQGEELFWRFPGVWKPGRSSTAPVHDGCPRARCCRSFPTSPQQEARRPWCACAAATRLRTIQLDCLLFLLQALELEGRSHREAAGEQEVVCRYSYIKTKSHKQHKTRVNIFKTCKTGLDTKQMSRKIN